MTITHYFADEAGDPTLFVKGGKVVVTTEGCSRFFIEGKLECRDVDALATDLQALRTEVLADPYFKGVPSLNPARKRTALQFHAKDDPAEVRFLVFCLLAKHELRFVAVVRDKLKLLDYATQRKRIDPAYRYDANGHELYDALTRKIFSRLHGFGEHRVVFAQRGQAPVKWLAGSRKTMPRCRQWTITCGRYSAFTSGVKRGIWTSYGRKRWRSLTWMRQPSRSGAVRWLKV